MNFNVFFFLGNVNSETKNRCLHFGDVLESKCFSSALNTILNILKNMKRIKIIL